MWATDFDVAVCRCTAVIFITSGLAFEHKMQAHELERERAASKAVVVEHERSKAVVEQAKTKLEAKLEREAFLRRHERELAISEAKKAVARERARAAMHARGEAMRAEQAIRDERRKAGIARLVAKTRSDAAIRWADEQRERVIRDAAKASREAERAVDSERKRANAALAMVRTLDEQNRAAYKRGKARGKAKARKREDSREG